MIVWIGPVVERKGELQNARERERERERERTGKRKETMLTVGGLGINEQNAEEEKQEEKCLSSRITQWPLCQRFLSWFMRFFSSRSLRELECITNHPCPSTSITEVNRWKSSNRPRRRPYDPLGERGLRGSAIFRWCQRRELIICLPWKSKGTLTTNSMYVSRRTFFGCSSSF